MKSITQLTLIILLGHIALSCNSQNRIKMIKKHVRIDDKVIGMGDPMKVIYPLWWSVSIYDSKDSYERDLKPFSVHQRAVFALIWYIEEVNNGGHYQFYSNSTGIVWEDAMNGFELIGLMEGKQIIEESAKRFGSRPSFDREERGNMLAKIDQEFDDLDTRFYKLDRELDIMQRIADYILKNKTAFYFEGDIVAPE